MQPTHKRFHAIIYGRVQGVSFRYSTQQTARELGVCGWVRNLADRSVEVMAEGTEVQLNALLAFLKEGPPAARVSHIDVQWWGATGEFGEFEIR